jgi:hypothetical protein
MDIVTIPYHYFASLYHTVRQPNLFHHVRTYIMFIGYPRSGHTLIGFLLDAHANAMIASQTTALRYLRHGFSVRQTFHMLSENSHRVSKVGREGRPYSYDVPNQWQGRCEKLEVIGDCTGFTRLRRNPELLKTLREKLGEIDLRLIHVVRNPYDNISTMKLRSGESLSDAVKRYFAMCELVEHLKSHVASGAVYDLSHEALISDTRGTLRNLCSFVGLSASENYLNDCAGIVYKSPHKSRHEVAWTQELIDSVKQHMRHFAHLSGYSYED